MSYELKPTSDGYMALARTFGRQEVLATSIHGGLPVSESERINVSLYDSGHENAIRKREFPDMPSARDFLIKLARFLERNGSVADQFSWSDATP